MYPTSLTQLNETTTAAINEIKENYATNESVDAKISSVNTPSIEGLATIDYVNNKVADIEIPDITNLATKTEVQAVNTKVEAIEVPDVSNLATTSYVDTKVLEAATGGAINLEGLATKEDLDSKQDKLTPDSTIRIGKVAKVTSKNFINPNAKLVENGYYNELGVFQSSIGYYTLTEMPIEPNKVYTYSITPKMSGGHRLEGWDRDGNFVTELCRGNFFEVNQRCSFTFNTPENVYYISLSYFSSETPDISQPQVELGNVMTDYDPTYEVEEYTEISADVTKEVLKINGVQLTKNTTSEDLGIPSYKSQEILEYDFDSPEIIEAHYINASMYTIGSIPDTLKIMTFNTNEFNVLPEIELLAGSTISLAISGGGNARAFFILDKETGVVLDVAQAGASYSESNPYTYTCEKDVILYLQPRRSSSNPVFKAHIIAVKDKTPTVNGIKITDNPVIDGNNFFVENYTAEDYDTDTAHFFLGEYYALKNYNTGDIVSFTKEYATTWNSWRFDLNIGDTIKVTNVGGSNAKGFYAISKTTNEALLIKITTSSDNSVEYTATEPCWVGGGTEDANKSIFKCTITRNTSALCETIAKLNDPDKAGSNVTAVSGGCKFLNPKPCYYKDEFRILDIGNSFTQDPTYDIPGLVCALGVDVSKIAHCTAIRGGASYKNWYDVYYGKDASGGVSKLFGEASVDLLSSGTAQQKFVHALTNNTWDIILIHQVSTYSHDYTTWEGTSDSGYLKELIRLLRFHQPQAHIGFLMVHGSYSNNSDTVTRWKGIAKSAQYMQATYGMDVVIPVGTAIQNLRASTIASSATKGLCGDGHHLADGIARYTAALAYYESLLAPYFKKSMYTSAFMPTRLNTTSDTIPVTAANRQVCQMAAMLAVTDMYNINNPDGLFTGPEPTE